MKKIITVIALLLMFCITTGCAKSESYGTEDFGGLKNDVLVTLAAPLDLYDTKSLYLNDNEITEAESYYVTVSKSAPEKAYMNLEKKLGLTEPILGVYGQLYFYHTCAEYEFLLFDNAFVDGEKAWNIFFIVNDEIIHSVIPKSDDISSVFMNFQAESDKVYLYLRDSSKTISQTLASDIHIFEVSITGAVQKKTIPIEKLNKSKIALGCEQVYIKNNKLIICNEDIASVIAVYDMETETAVTAVKPGIFNKVLQYDDGYITIALKTDDSEMLVEQYDSELNTVSSKPITCSLADISEYTMSINFRSFCMINNQLHGVVVSKLGYNQMAYIVVDPSTAEAVYFKPFEDELYSYVSFNCFVMKNGRMEFLDLYENNVL